MDRKYQVVCCDAVPHRPGHGFLPNSKDSFVGIRQHQMCKASKMLVLSKETEVSM